jgi:hypothetical protein
MFLRRRDAPNDGSTGGFFPAQKIQQFLEMPRRDREKQAAAGLRI